MKKKVWKRTGRNRSVRALAPASWQLLKKRAARKTAKRATFLGKIMTGRRIPKTEAGGCFLDDGE